MLNGKENFKFYILPEQVFTLEKLLIENNIEFHNELELHTNSRSNKYYIKNTDRNKLDIIAKNNNLEIYTDTIPRIETRLFNSKLTFIHLFYFLIILLIITLALIK